VTGVTVRDGTAAGTATVDGTPTAAGTAVTPLVPLRVRVAEVERVIRLKLEGTNPGGSVKFRTARGLLASLPEARLSAPGTTLVESTSGNLGVGLAMLAAARSLPFVAVVDAHVTPELVRRLEDLGARVEVAFPAEPRTPLLEARLAVVRDLVARSSRYLWTDQYANPANPLVHYRETGPELDAQAPPGVAALFAAVSTGGTFAGLARWFREHRPGLQLVAVDVRGSLALPGGELGPRHLSGIGSARPSTFVRPWCLDLAMRVPEIEAVRWCRRLDQATGLRLGASGGAVLAACLARMAAVPALRDVVCLCPDLGPSYRSTVYDDGWVVARGWDLDAVLAPDPAVRFLGLDPCPAIASRGVG